MTAAPFTATHRKTLKALAAVLRAGYTGKTNAEAIDAALAEIKRLKSALMEAAGEIQELRRNQADVLVAVDAIEAEHELDSGGNTATRVSRIGVQLDYLTAEIIGRNEMEP